MIKQIKSIWNWTKDKTRRFWKWGVAIVIGGAVLAAVIPSPNVSFENLSNVRKIENKYEITLGEDKVEIGDFDNPDFKPIAKMWRWNKENYLTIKYPTTKKISPKQEDGKLKWADTDKELHFYPEGENLKIIVVLKEKPATNTYTFELEGWEEFNFFYQTPFKSPEHFIRNEEEWLRVTYPSGSPIVRDERPANVDGSYAVYHKTKRDHIIGQTNYKTGIAFHIYRPKAVDDNGKSVWTDLHIENGVYTVTIPKDFLDTAKYPVTINDTFGYTTVGSSQSGLATNIVWAFGSYSPEFSGAVTSVSVYFYTGAEFSGTVGIYDDVDSEAENLLGESVGGTFTGGPTWLTQDLESAVFVSGGTNYWLAQNNNRSGTCTHMYNAGTEDADSDAQTYDDGNLLTTFVREGSSDNKKYSIYATYTPLIDDLVSYWKLDDNLDTSPVIDIHGDNDGAVDNGETDYSSELYTATSKIVSAFDFDGSDDIVEIPTSASLQITGNMTVCFWMNADVLYNATTWIGILSRYNTGDADRCWNFAIPATTIVEYIEDDLNFWVSPDGESATGLGVAIDIATEMVTGTWYHICGRYDGSTIKIYKNAVEKDSEAYSAGIHGDPEPVVMGNYRTFVDYYDGIMDEVTIWNRALDPTEITALYNGGAGLAYPFTAVEGTNMQINIGDAWKDVDSMQINIGDVWKDVAGVQINIGDAWETIY